MFFYVCTTKSPLICPRISWHVVLCEVSDVVLLDPKAEVGARNSRRLAALYAGSAAGFEVTHHLFLGAALALC